ncbi:type I restriction endonuclease subunit R [Thiocystis violascens]|uniref:type I site-specific deoxyribonuclease n=1 Tax=Thiocystis violascens (strain ATCC 17096 / DSM 198 / 6111) TaxID=765911 RepID=I3Y966_THIV6|nr:type I restriction endonuclease [Thiocystis violascens]AFL73534.1 helicase, type I site-specific restriction-modification system restriction subunit [Thiocystis violascens DSM 198]
MDLPELPPPTSTPTEWSEVERPLLLHLHAMGWEVLCLENEQDKIDYPSATGRRHFREVVQYDTLRAAIRRINDADGPLDDLTIERAIRELEKTGGQGLIERNRLITERLITGVYVSTGDGQRQRLIRFIEFDPERRDRNTFTVINQYRVDLPGGGSFVIPDLVLLINGLPLVVIECKSPALSDPIGEGLDQLLRYSNQRDWIDEDEGIEDLFLYNQLMVVTDFYEARVGTLGALHEHYQPWKDVAPWTPDAVARELGKTADSLKSQELLAAGMLRPERLLDILQHFILFKTDDGKLIKVAPRYQQYRAVCKAIERLMTGTTRRQNDRDQDRRGGIVWHTQGSGKSITMVYLVRKLRTEPALRAFKVVVVTDRTDLEKQLRETLALTGENARPDERDLRRSVSDTDRLKGILAEEGPDVVFAMIQKYLDRTGEVEVFEYEVPLKPAEHLDRMADGPGIPARVRTLRQTVRRQEFGVLNAAEQILILVDECHRSHTETFHANMMAAMPNAARIGFTGTPILKQDKAHTQGIFGEFIDKYRLKEAEEDEATVRILYEGRTTDGLVEHTDRLDRAFADLFRDYTDAEQQVIRNRYATTGDVLEAPKLIAEKAADMLYHYVRKIMPDGFKAQVVSVSRRAVLTYRESLGQARDALVAEIAGLDPAKLALEPKDLEQEDPWVQFLVGAHPRLETIKRLEFAAVVSHDHNDPPSWRQWTDKTKRNDHIARFKKPLVQQDPEKQDGMAFLCVQNMLLTGFDAPVEQVLYLDRKIVAHDLLQAIARVNRRARGKDCGYVVDYIGVARHLHDALGDYEDETHDPMTDIRDELPNLRDRHKAAIDVFLTRGIKGIRDIEACVDLLEDVKIRAEFINKLRAFLQGLSIVMPRPEAMPYQPDAKILGFIAKVAANLYHDPQLDLHGVHHKVKQLIDTYIAANGIDPKIPPIGILDVNFAAAVEANGSARARASQMSHAARHHITLHFNEDPDLYATFSAKLESILEALKDRWDELERELRQFIDAELRRGRDEEIEGLDPKVQAPFFGLIKRHLTDKDHPQLADATLRTAIETTVAVVDAAREAIGRVGFWRDPVSRQGLEKTIYRLLRRSRIVPNETLAELASRLVDLAKSRHRFLVS